MDKETNLELNFERISLLYSNGYLTLLGIAVCFFSLVLVVQPLLRPEYFFAWVALALCSVLPRVYLILQFGRGIKSSQINRDNIHAWEGYWVLSTIAPALVFVSLPYFPFYSDDIVVSLFVALALLGMTSGSIISSNMSFKTVLTFFVCSSLLFILHCLLKGGRYYFTLGFAYTAFFLIFLMLAKRLNHIVVNGLRLQLENRTNALKDSLTGLWNRRQLKIFTEQLVNQTKRTKVPFSVILFDVDHFKRTNDTYGHSVGDTVLKQIADDIVACSREGDLVVRYGGEEFLVVLPGAINIEARTLAERVLCLVRGQGYTTISAGVAEYVSGESMEELISRADTGLYQAKGSGRDCVVIEQPVELSGQAALI